MFGLLKNKLKAFVDGIVKREETKEAKPSEAKPAEAAKPSEAQPAAIEAKPAEAKPIPATPAVEVKPAKVTPVEVKPKPSESKPSPKPTAKSVEDEIYAEAERQAAAEISEETKETKENPKPAESKREEPRKTEASPTTREEKREEAPAEAPTEAKLREAKPYFEVKKPAEEPKKELAPKLGLLKRITSVFSSEIEIGEAEVAPMLNDLEMALLESDVSYDTTQFLVSDLKRRLVGKRVAKNALGTAVQNEVRSALLDLFPIPRSTFEQEIKRKKASGEPLVVLFLGPNGMGKTTTIAKIARWLDARGYSSVLAAGDSFRAAAIEQLEHHGRALGREVIKHKYGADPTAVAFDAVAHARAKKIDVVLVDTAGRQETNVNLVKEMEKMTRVLKPDLRVFVGEAVAGHALVEQLKRFKETAGVDALVLTKLDCDAKGGSAFSAAFEAKLPILFVGVGQEYADLREFDAAWLVNNVIAS